MFNFLLSYLLLVLSNLLLFCLVFSCLLLSSLLIYCLLISPLHLLFLHLFSSTFPYRFHLFFFSTLLFCLPLLVDSFRRFLFCIPLLVPFPSRRFLFCLPLPLSLRCTTPRWPCCHTHPVRWCQRRGVVYLLTPPIMVIGGRHLSRPLYGLEMVGISHIARSTERGMDQTGCERQFCSSLYPQIKWLGLTVTCCCFVLLCFVVLCGVAVFVLVCLCLSFCHWLWPWLLLCVFLYRVVCVPICCFGYVFIFLIVLSFFSYFYPLFKKSAKPWQFFGPLSLLLSLS